MRLSLRKDQFDGDTIWSVSLGKNGKRCRHSNRFDAKGKPWKSYKFHDAPTILANSRGETWTYNGFFNGSGTASKTNLKCQAFNSGGTYLQRALGHTVADHFCGEGWLDEEAYRRAYWAKRPLKWRTRTTHGRQNLANKKPLKPWDALSAKTRGEGEFVNHFQKLSNHEVHNN